MLASAAVIALVGNLTPLYANERNGNKEKAGATAKAASRCGSAAGTLEQGSDLLQRSDFSGTVQVLQPLVDQQCDPRATLLLAAAWEGTGDPAKAEAVLQKAHVTWPSDPDIATSLARQFYVAGQIDKAAQALQHFRPVATTSPQALQLAVVVNLASHKLVDATSIARTYYAKDPSISSLLLLANALQLEGRYKDVISLMSDKRATYGDSAPFLVTLAQSEYDASIYDTARSDVERALSLDASLYAAHYLLGNILLKTGDPEAAEAQYRAAVQIEPNQPRTYYYLALTMRALHKEGEEEEVLAHAIELDSHYALAHCEMGRVLLNQNRLTDAVAHLEVAVHDNASSEQAYYLLSRAYDRLGDSVKAEAMAKQLAVVRKQNHQSLPTRSTGGDAVRDSTTP